MSQKKEEAIQKVMTEFESMANLVLSQLDRLESFFQSGETNLPEKLREEFDANEKLFDQYEVKLSERIINTIVLFQPVASDIRQLIACYRIIINLERIGDYTINIVKFFSEIKNWSCMNNDWCDKPHAHYQHANGDKIAAFLHPSRQRIRHLDNKKRRYGRRYEQEIAQRNGFTQQIVRR